MDIFLTYLTVFGVGGLVCLVGQVLINRTKMSTARILVTFLIIGAILELAGVFESMKEFASSGVTIPIMGFGSSLARGALDGSQENGVLGAIGGGMEAVSAGLTTAIVCGFIFGMLSKSRSKKF